MNDKSNTTSILFKDIEIARKTIATCKDTVKTKTHEQVINENRSRSNSNSSLSSDCRSNSNSSHSSDCSDSSDSSDSLSTTSSTTTTTRSSTNWYIVGEKHVRVMFQCMSRYECNGFGFKKCFFSTKSHP